MLGNNMFIYCGNNPIICSDITGQKMVSAIRGEMSGGSPDVVATSDQQEESEQLMNEMIEQLSDMSQYGTVHISVQYLGKYTEPANLTWGDWATSVGLFVGGLLAPGIPVIGPTLSIALLTTDAYLLVDDLGELLHPGLPGEAEYHQYKVVASWSEEHSYSGGKVVSINRYEFYYVRDDRRIDNPQWYLQGVAPVCP